MPLPAVLSVKEGINLPRYPSVPGRLRAKSKEVERLEPAWSSGGMRKIGPAPPRGAGHAPSRSSATAPEAAATVVDLSQRIGVLAR